MKIPGVKFKQIFQIYPLLIHQYYEGRTFPKLSGCLFFFSDYDIVMQAQNERGGKMINFSCK